MTRARRAGAAALSLFSLLIAGCSAGDRSARDAPESSAAGTGSSPSTTSREPWFVDVTQASGIDFVHTNGASARRYLPETMGAGVACFDADGDSLPDLYFPNGGRLGEPGAAPEPARAAFYRNLGDCQFRDESNSSGLGQSFFGLGTAVGDVDRDGDIDLFVSGLFGDRLFRNDGGGRFSDVTAVYGLTARGFGSSCAFLDYDRDGDLDLFVGRYVAWSRDADQRCSPDGTHFVYCTPESYAGTSSLLYRNVEGRRFEDVTRVSGIGGHAGKALGVAVLDHDGDGWPDLAVANDTERNFLFVNEHDGTFVERAVETGFAYTESGSTRGGMGIDAADVDDDGRSEILIGNFSHEMVSFYRGLQTGRYVDDAMQAGIGLPSLMTLAFGALFEDLDGDGWLDVVIANGHIEPDIQLLKPSERYAQPLQLFRNLGPSEAPVGAAAGTTAAPGGSPRFEFVQDLPGGALDAPLVGRGLASADLDRDGDLDVVVTQSGASARVLRNDAPKQSWLALRCLASEGRPDPTPFGLSVIAEIRVDRQPRTLRRSLEGGRSYLSAPEPTLRLGLGRAARVAKLSVTWPGGSTREYHDVTAGQFFPVTAPAETNPAGGH